MNRLTKLLSRAPTSLLGHVSGGNVESGPAAPLVIIDPSDTSAEEGSTATFTVVCTGNPFPTIQWEVSTDGGLNWSNVGSDSSSYTTPVLTLSDDGNLYRAQLTNTEGSATSSSATLTVTEPASAPTFTTQPSNQSAFVDGTATFTAVATGNPAPTYQWQRSTDGGTNYSNISGATSASYTTPVLLLSNDGEFYRVIATNTEGSATSTAAELTVTSYAPENLPGILQYALDNGEDY